MAEETNKVCSGNAASKKLEFPLSSTYVDVEQDARVGTAETESVCVCEREKWSLGVSV